MPEVVVTQAGTVQVLASTPQTVSVRVGSQGPPGPQGDPGNDGADGAPGADGADGTNGSDGADGADGAPGSVWYTGSGAPSGGTGINGDYYFRTSNDDVYFKAAGSWSVIANIKGSQGIQGIPGTNGTDGKTVRNGTTVPSGGLGVDGDFYIRTTTSEIYGPKASGAWGSPTSLVGATGSTGPPGADGNDGADGADGQGVPTGGTTGQVLEKASNSDFDTVWATLAGSYNLLTDAVWNAKGDLVSGSANDTAVITSVGTNGTFLKADSTAPGGISWASVTQTTLANDTLWDAQGDIAVATGNDAAAILSKGATGTVLTAGASTLSWVAPKTVATDTIWDAAGDLAVGSGADTAAKLSIGTALQYLRVNSGATGLEWATLKTVATDTIWDTAGDLVYGTGADTAAKLAIGTAGQVLTVNGGATAPAWSTPLTTATDTIWTTKGQIAAATGAGAAQALGVGSNGQVLTADSTQTTGLKWATPSAAGTVAVKAWGGASYSADSDVVIFVGPSTQDPVSASGGRDQANDIWITTDNSGLATDTLWDAKGDLVVGTGSDAAAKLTVGANDLVLQADSSQSTGVKWATPKGQVLAYTVYDPSARTDVNTTSSTYADVDATNLQVTFTVPASGAVEVELTATAIAGSSSALGWGVRESTTVIAACNAAFGNGTSGRFVVKLLVTGLTPGASKTYKFAHARTSGASTCTTSYGFSSSITGDRVGPAQMTIRAM